MLRVFRSFEERSALIQYLKEHEILSVFHYLTLHKSDYYTQYYDDYSKLRMCDHYADCLIRLLMFYELTNEEVGQVIGVIHDFYQNTYCGF